MKIKHLATWNSGKVHDLTFRNSVIQASGFVSFGLNLPRGGFRDYPSRQLSEIKNFKRACKCPSKNLGQNVI
jgi:hypothetical protein